MPGYDDRWFQPPAPVVTATLENAQTGSRVTDLVMLIDTGADVTLLPSIAVNAAGIGFDEIEYELLDFGGNRHVSRAVSAGLRAFGKTFRGKFLVIEGGYGIVGRDILNSVSVLLDGPNLAWSENAARNG